MALNQRQQAAYNHRVNLWQPSRVINPISGAVGAETYTLAYSNVACRYEYTDNVADPVEGVGRTKRPTIFTTDKIHFDSAQEVGADWIVKNISLLPDGSRSQLYGEFHRVLGVSKITPSAGLRRANKRSMMAQTIEKIPAGVS